MVQRPALRPLALPAATFLAGAVLATALGVHAAPTGSRLPASPPALAPTVLDLAATELRVAPNKQATIRLMAEGRRAFVGMLTMQPGAAVPDHVDGDEEFIHILEGGGELTIDGKAYPVAAGTTIFMPGGAHVSYVNGATALKALQVFAGPGSAAKYSRWTPIKATAPAGPRRGPPGR
jgi:quercetin dioxygenase-like cupin family protein